MASRTFLRVAAWAVVAFALSTARAAEPARPTIDEVKIGVARAEQAFTNLYIKDFHTTIDTQSPGENEWTSTPMVHAGSAWYDGQNRGKVRGFFAHSVLPWAPFPNSKPLPGQVPWVECASDMSWNGNEGREVRIASGFPGKERPGNSARVSADRPIQLDGYSRFKTGAGFTLAYYVWTEELTTPPQEPVTLSQRIERSIALNAPPELTREVVNGFETIRIRWANPQGLASDTFWVAPACGYALVKHQYILNLPDQGRTETLEVKELKDAGEGAWFPLRGMLIRQMGGPGRGYWRYTFTAADAVANDPKFDESIFLAPLPRGYMVADVRGQRRDYVILDDGTEQDFGPGQAVPRTKAQKPVRPDGER